jgi:hypothetical protein
MQRCIEHTDPNLVGVNKLAQAIKRVGFVARQFALWVVPEKWFNSEEEPDVGEQAIMVCFLGYTLCFAPAIGKCTVYTVCFATAIVKCIDSLYYAFCNSCRKIYSLYYTFCNGYCDDTI